MVLDGRPPPINNSEKELTRKERSTLASQNTIAPIAQLVSVLDLVTSSVHVKGSILTAGKMLSLKNLNVIIRAIN